jgi:putative membrane protein
MKYLIFLLTVALLSACSSNNKAATSEKSSNASQPSPSPAAETSPGSNTASGNKDQAFVQDAIKGNRAEVTLGKMVASKTNNASVKQFAELMVKDHTQALSQLTHLAQQKSITIPQGLPEDAQQLQSKLQSETGTQFDKDYMDGMVKDHQKDLQEFQDQAQNAQDPEVKQLAAKLVPTLQEHLDKAQKVDDKVNSGRTGDSSSGGAAE